MQNLILNRYRVIDTAGRGGFATVQVAWDTRIQRRVAIKCLPLEGKVGAGQPAGSSGVDAVQIPGLDEARTAAMLSDPNIVGVYDFEVADGMAYMIMEYVDGVTLTRFMRDFGGPLPLDVIATVFGAVSHALEFAHENQVLHLDIKPDNVMINRQGQVKVTDFGLAELSHGAGFGQATGGTIGYMPLEQMRLEAPDERTDEWALAALTYEMFTGDNPFFAPDLDRAEAAIEDAELVVPSLARGDVHPAIDDILFDALSIDRDGRFESVAAFAEALEPYLGDPRKGMRQLAVLVGEACEDYEEAAAAEGPDARMPLDFLSDRARSALYRVFSATACAGLGMLSLANIPQLFAPVAVAGANAVTAADAAALAGAAGSASAAGSVAAAGSASAVAGAAAFAGPPTAVFFGLAALLALGALISPPLGALLSVLLLAAALFCNGAHVMAVAVAAAGVAWWYFSGRGSSAAASSGVAPMWFGALGFGALAPLACGYVLRVRDAAICSAFAFLLAFVLACSGSMSVFDWGALVNWRFSNHMEATAVAMLASPGTWISLAAWVGAACVFAASCIRGTRPVAFMGAVAASALLIGGVMLSAWFASGMVSCVPPLWTIVPVSVSCAAAVAATFAGVPWKERAR